MYKLMDEYVVFYVRDGTSKRHPAKKIFVARASDAISEIKLMIHERMPHLPLSRQRLAWHGKQLEHGRTLADYNIKQDATLLVRST